MRNLAERIVGAAQICRLAALAAGTGRRRDESRANPGSAAPVCCICSESAANCRDSWRKSSVSRSRQQQICSKSAAKEQRPSRSTHAGRWNDLWERARDRKDQRHAIEIARFSIPKQEDAEFDGDTSAIFAHGRHGKEIPRPVPCIPGPHCLPIRIPMTFAQRFGDDHVK